MSEAQSDLNDTLPDGSIADRNYVWFTDWYLANLNSFYTAPIDYHLWRALNERSPIRSERHLAGRQHCRPKLRMVYRLVPRESEFLLHRSDRLPSLAGSQ